MLQGMELRNFRKGHHLYSAGQPLSWVSAQILVFQCSDQGHSHGGGRVPERPTMSPYIKMQNDNRQFVFGADF